MMSKESSTSGGIGFAGLLTIVFMVLKLCKVIDWSWWYVTMPLWLPAIIVIVILVIYFLLMIAKGNKFTTFTPR